MAQRRGYSLSEILIAIAVAAIAILGLATLTMSVWKSAKFGKFQAYASSLARQPLERMRGDQSYYRTLMDGPAAGRSFATDFEVDDGQPVRFEGELSFTRLAPPQDRYVRIISRVHWVQQKTNREVVLETILPEPSY